MNFLVAWLAKNELAELSAEINALKTALNSTEREVERLLGENEALEKKITGLEAVIEYAKTLHDQMFDIIKAFAPRPLAEMPTSPVGGSKTWPSIRRELEKKNVESGPKA